MDRRDFVSTGLAAAVAARLSTPAPAAEEPRPGKFKLKYAPHFDMFKNCAGADYLDQLKFISDQGFTALEDNGMMSRAVELQEKVAKEMARLELTMGVFVAYSEWKEPRLPRGNVEDRDAFLAEIKKSVECAKRVNAKWCTVVPGPYHLGMDWGYQTANVVEALRRAAELCEPSGLVMVLESLNPRNHPGMFLTKIAQAFEICRAVNSPSCKILDDLYHQQVTEGNLIPNMDQAWSEIAYFQLGDNPGRNEPGTGEVNYRNVFKHIHEKGFTGVIGMEHGNSMQGKEGELAVVEAYRQCDIS